MTTAVSPLVRAALAVLLLGFAGALFYPLADDTLMPRSFITEDGEAAMFIGSFAILAYAGMMLALQAQAKWAALFLLTAALGLTAHAVIIANVL